MTTTITENVINSTIANGQSAGAVAALIAAHNAATTSVHGIADTSALDTTTARNAAIAAAATGGATASDQLLISWVLAGLEPLTITYNVTYPTVISTATVKWPDGSSGVYTVDAFDTTFLIETAFHITHVDSGKTVTQTAVTLNANGDLASKDAMTVA